jgi:RNA polymerase sigma-70 factor (ECF subfamily)
MRAGDQSAFDAFFATYAPRIAAFVSRRSSLDRAGVEDMVQTSLIKAIRSLESFRGEASLFTWLCTICRHELASLHRKTQRQPVHASTDGDAAMRDELLELRVPADNEPPNELELEAHRAAVAKALNCLPERYARVLEWKYGDGFSVEEIAAMLGLTPIAAQSLLARARKEFKEVWLREHS